jgi:hypothetical protein
MVDEVAGVILTGVIKTVGGGLIAIAGIVVLIHVNQLPEQRLKSIGSVLNPFVPEKWRIANARLTLGSVSVIILGGGVLLCAVGVAELLGHKF